MKTSGESPRGSASHIGVSEIWLLSMSFCTTITACIGLCAGVAGCTAAAQPVGSRTYVPAPEPVMTAPCRVGALLCPLWDDGTRWQTIVPYPMRKPLLGWYDEGTPEVTDWEISWARNHGISFFLVCWYRQKGNFGEQQVKPALGHWLHEGLEQARYRDRIDVAIMWENGHRQFDGNAEAKDLLEALLPYWIETYFRRTNYLRLDNRPVLGIYRVDRFIDDLGGEAAAGAVIGQMRAACREAGFGGLCLLGQCCWGSPESLRAQSAAALRIGMDCTWAYHWPTFTGLIPRDGRPKPEDIIDAHARIWQAMPQPNILTVSMGWDSRPWGSMHATGRWRLNPAEFETLCRRARDVLASREPPDLSRRLLLVDGWNEFGEGHYVLPTEEHGFGYLDAVRRVFAPDAGPHRDTTPADLGLGPYDAAFRREATRRAAGGNEGKP